MTTAELKNDLHRMIVETQDSTVLEQISNYFAFIIEEKQQWDLLSNAEKKQIELGMEDLKNNRTISNEEMRLKVRKILQHI
jgi:methionine synthase II (cobalamin-independent)